MFIYIYIYTLLCNKLDQVWMCSDSHRGDNSDICVIVFYICLGLQSHFFFFFNSQIFFCFS